MAKRKAKKKTTKRKVARKTTKKKVVRKKRKGSKKGMGTCGMGPC